MKILLSPGIYLPHQRAGSEICLHRTCKYLLSKGHEVKAITRYPLDYHFERIDVYAQKKDYKDCHNDLWNWADLVFCQLSGTYYAMNKQKLMPKKVINFTHNNAGYPQINIRKNVFTVYNTEQIKKELNYNHDSFVLHPPVDYRDFVNVDITKAEYITLINHNENKGGQILIEIAKRLPNLKFMAVQGGYYHQIYNHKIKNIKYVGITDNIKKYLAKTKLMIAPSDYDSYGMAQVEALCCNIPVIASDILGFKESLADSAVYVKRNDIDAWVEAITNYEELFKNIKPIERAKELDPINDLAKLENWLLEICKLALK
jgi:glycosyltransferase involved in cell wall biosynthesis